MRKIAVLLGMFALLVVVPAQATVVTYSFTGNDPVGTPILNGTFFLDDSLLVVTDFVPNPPLGTLHEATLPPSPLDTITGTFNGIAFTGIASLQIRNFPRDSDTASGDWIVRSDITSADASLVHLNLGVHVFAGSVPINLMVPPTLGCDASSCNRRYDIIFADGTDASGELSLAVPELPAGVLLALAGTLLAFVRVHARRRREPCL